MRFITETQLSNQSRTRNISLNESLRNYKNESSTNKTKIFLSHKHDEKVYLDGAITFLKKFGVEVYVDWMDDGMPKTTSGQTAIRIKSKIKENHKFILLATEMAITSKWCNWELGLGDAAKYVDHIALLPVKKENSDFSGNEYLDIYPYIFIVDSFQFLKGDYKYPGTYIVFPAVNGTHKVIPIEQWLRNT